MVSNAHFAVDLLAHEVVKATPPSLDELMLLSDLPSQVTPFANQLKKDRFVRSDGTDWLFSFGFQEVDFQTQGYEWEVLFFELMIEFDSATSIDEISRKRFLYSLARNIQHSGWRRGKKGGETFFQFGDVDEGSIRANLWAGLLVLGAGISNYPNLKDGLQEILADSTFLAEKIQTALRASKLDITTDLNEPEPLDDQPLAEPEADLGRGRQRVRNERR